MPHALFILFHFSLTICLFLSRARALAIAAFDRGWNTFNVGRTRPWKPPNIKKENK